jgi:hypothetical protein
MRFAFGSPANAGRFETSIVFSIVNKVGEINSFIEYSQ